MFDGIVPYIGNIRNSDKNLTTTNCTATAKPGHMSCNFTVPNSKVI